MGLDMFLYGIHEDNKKDVFDPSSGDWEQCCYWRKANQIHSWFNNRFIKNQNPWGLYKIPEQDLQGLLLICKFLKKLKQNPSEELSFVHTKWFDNFNNIKYEGRATDQGDIAAYAILPPDNIGCFFGSGIVDELYWTQINDTVRQLTDALEKNYSSFFYTASW